MADQNITELPVKTSSGITSSDYMLGIDSAEGYQMLIRDLGDYIIRNVQVNTIAGANQTLKSALDTLNSKTSNGASFPFIANDVNAADYDILPVGLVYNQGVGEHCPDSNGYYLVLTCKARSNYENSKCQLAFSFFTSGVVKYRAQTGGTWREWVTL